jgi:hypothetical protein
VLQAGEQGREEGHLRYCFSGLWPVGVLGAGVPVLLSPPPPACLAAAAAAALAAAAAAAALTVLPMVVSVLPHSFFICTASRGCRGSAQLCLPEAGTGAAAKHGPQQGRGRCGSELRRASARARVTGARRRRRFTLQLNDLFPGRAARRCRTALPGEPGCPPEQLLAARAGGDRPHWPQTGPAREHSRRRAGASAGANAK